MNSFVFRVLRFELYEMQNPKCKIQTPKLFNSPISFKTLASRGLSPCNVGRKVVLIR